MIMGIGNIGIDSKYVNSTLFAGMVNFRQKSIKPYREYDGDTMGTSRGKNGYRNGKNINGIMLEKVENPLSCGRVCGCVTNACSSYTWALDLLLDEFLLWLTSPTPLPTPLLFILHLYPLYPLYPLPPLPLPFSVSFPISFSYFVAQASP